MSTSQIPNLNSLRSARAGRGRGFGRGPHATTGPDDPAAQDRIVQQTDQDASLSRVSAVEVGYLHDAFARCFVAGEPQRRFPIINRGTFVRTNAIDTLLAGFLAGEPEEKRQIVSLGAGSDTRYFRLREQNPRLPMLYHELDFAANTTRKIASIRRHSHLLSLIKQGDQEPSSVVFSEEGDSLLSPTYNIHPIDLRSLHTPNDGDERPVLPNVDPTMPTLLISECCLIYLAPDHADGILKYFSQLIAPGTSLGLVIYEPINPTDAFGKVMVQNLAARGIVLQTLKRYSSLERQKERMRSQGFRDGQGAADVDFIFERWVPEEEKERVAGLEMLDEIEEWRMLARHYCVAWGWRNGGSDGKSPFQSWSTIEGQSGDE